MLAGLRSRLIAMRTLAFVLLLGSTTLIGAAPTVDLSWLAGDWRRCKDGEIVEERWLGPRGDLMVGANLTSSARGRTSFEHMRIVRVDGAWTFWAEPNGRAATPFALAESGAQRAVFANPEHVFPARVVYWRDGADLMARIEGTVKDQPASVEWRFSAGTAADCPRSP